MIWDEHRLHHEGFAGCWWVIGEERNMLFDVDCWWVGEDRDMLDADGKCNYGG